MMTNKNDFNAMVYTDFVAQKLQKRLLGNPLRPNVINLTKKPI